MDIILNNEGTDRISTLSDDIIIRILMFVPIKNAVATTVLSQRWLNAWTLVPFRHLDLDDSALFHDDPDRHPSYYKIRFSNFVAKVLRSGLLGNVRSFRLCCWRTYGCWRLRWWLKTLCTPNIVEVDIALILGEPDSTLLPAVLYTSTSLEVLKLNANIHLRMPDNEVCFPSLKVLYIFVHDVGDDDFTTRLYSRCPVLQDLSIEGHMADTERVIEFNISSVTLKNLRIEFEVYAQVNNDEYSFVIHAENLEYLYLSDEIFANYTLENLQLIHRAEISIGYTTMCPMINGLPEDFDNDALGLLRGLSHVQSLYLSGATVGVFVSFIRSIHQNDDEDDDDEEDEEEYIHPANFLPIFSFLKNLELCFLDCCSWNFLRYILGQSPNLEHLVLEKVNFRMVEEIEECGEPWEGPDTVPDCLLHHVKDIEVRRFEGRYYQLQVVEYLLRNSQVLQRMAIYCQAEEHMHHNAILGYPRGSEACEIQFVIMP